MYYKLLVFKTCNNSIHVYAHKKAGTYRTKSIINAEFSRNIKLNRILLSFIIECKCYAMGSNIYIFSFKVCIAVNAFICYFNFAFLTSFAALLPPESIASADWKTLHIHHLKSSVLLLQVHTFFCMDDH